MFGSVIMKSIVLNICPSKCIQIILQLHGHCTYSNSLYFQINFGWMIWKFISDLRKLYVHRTRQIFWSNISTWQSHKHVVSIYFWNIWFPLIPPVSSVLLTRNPVSEILLSFCTRIYVLHEKGTAVHSRSTHSFGWVQWSPCKTNKNIRISFNLYFFGVNGCLLDKLLWQRWLWCALNDLWTKDGSSFVDERSLPQNQDDMWWQIYHC